MTTEIPIEKHPLKPFLPPDARILMFGSFPPKRERWSMEFYYPNIQNDMWRIMGIIFFDDKEFFVETAGKKSRFGYEKVLDFCNEKRIAIFDAATSVRRLQDNASDAFLEIVEPTNIPDLLSKIPECRTIVSTGGKSAETIAEQLGCKVPKVGECSEFSLGEKQYIFFRMPSSSRAYPLKIEQKAEMYKRIFGLF